mmetsp:Transcript_9158/g.22488  ORF Transcript_9158/g.22488 Transcript_9158/m.22488 type:complete len:273 (-) Transcript_9158:203-1021(-)
MFVFRRPFIWFGSLFFAKDNQASIFRTPVEHWKRERPILARNYQFLIMCLVFQWVHNLATNLARFLYVPQTPLYDIGFVLIPMLEQRFEFLCDVVFGICIIITIILWLSPFFKSDYSQQSSVGMLSRFMAVLVLSQSLRILTFVMTDLPGPSPRCKPDDPFNNQPKSLGDILWRSCVGMFSHGCGELVFSSRMLIVVLCLLVVVRYGRGKWLKINFGILAALYACLMIAARREYTLSIFIACYTVPLVWIAHGRNFPDEGFGEILPTRQPKE